MNSQLSKERNFKILFRNLEHVLFCKILQKKIHLWSAVTGQSASVVYGFQKFNCLLISRMFQSPGHMHGVHIKSIEHPNHHPAINLFLIHHTKSAAKNGACIPFVIEEGIPVVGNVAAWIPLIADCLPVVWRAIVHHLKVLQKCSHVTENYT